MTRFHRGTARILRDRESLLIDLNSVDAVMNIAGLPVNPKDNGPQLRHNFFGWWNLTRVARSSKLKCYRKKGENLRCGDRGAL
jgi:hypothetical protein